MVFYALNPHFVLFCCQLYRWWCGFFFIWITSPYPSELLHWYSVRKSREIWTNKLHYSNVILSAMASQITGVWIVCSTVCSGADKKKHQSSVSLAFVRGIHRWRVGSRHKGPVTRKMFPFDDTIMMIINGICCVIDYHSTSIHREKNINKLFASGTISAQDIRQFRKIGFLFILIYTLKQLLNERSYFSYSKQHFIQIWYLYQSFIYIYKYMCVYVCHWKSSMWFLFLSIVV